MLNILKKLVAPKDWRPIKKMDGVNIVEYDINKKAYRHRFYNPDTREVTAWYKGRPTWHQLVP